jgi:hypothetical protein
MAPQGGGSDFFSVTNRFKCEWDVVLLALTLIIPLPDFLTS